MQEQSDVTRVHSKEIEDVIYRIPPWIVRWGTTVTAIMFFLVIAGCCIFKYPDIITLPFIVFQTDKPITLTARSSGYLSEIKIGDGNLVEKNQMIAIIENTASTRDVFILQQTMVSFDTASDIEAKVNRTEFPENLQVGNMRFAYLSMLKSINDYKEVSSKRDTSGNLVKQERLKVIRRIIKDVLILTSSWQNQHVLRAPISGKLNYLGSKATTKYVRTGDTFVIIVPTTLQITVKAQLPIQKVGKIKMGQKALIKLSPYPYQEFGMLQAVVKENNITQDGTYTVKLALLNNLTTTKNKSIIAGPSMQGTVDIMTDDRSIFQRIFFN